MSRQRQPLARMAAASFCGRSAAEAVKDMALMKIKRVELCLKLSCGATPEIATNKKRHHTAAFSYSKFLFLLFIFSFLIRFDDILLQCHCH
jgi:hypothetical protein